MIGFATVTSQGIMFWDEAYGAGLALKERWFQLECCFVVEVESICPKHQAIVIRYMGKKTVCHKLCRNKLLSDEEIALYYEYVQTLQQQRKVVHNKKPITQME